MRNPNRFGDEKLKHQIRRENAKADKQKRKRVRPLVSDEYYESEWQQEVEAFVRGDRSFDVV